MSRWPLFWVAAVSIAPFLLAYLTFYLWAPESRMNYGELIEAPRPLPDVALTLADGRPFRLGALRGKWILTQVDPGACDEGCQRRLYHMRQVRRAQGKNMDRIERVWLISDDTPLDPAVVQAFDGTHFVRAAGSGVLREPALAADPSGHIYLIDPLGNLMMRFPRDADPTRILRDITRLLKASQVG
ncbi:MAG TPA: cytochrome C oxidase subunit I [Burkholderiales bacterium]|nr:cytochrome C oxidase subunit I [Burkholderiales bacterium]